MKLAYIAGKYRTRSDNQKFEQIILARTYARKYWLLGYAVICPHMNTAFMDGEDTEDMFLNGDLAILDKCDIIVMLPNWKDSEGAKAELEYAISKGKEVIYET